jgi:hypothetical protein
VLCTPFATSGEFLMRSLGLWLSFKKGELMILIRPNTDRQSPRDPTTLLSSSCSKLLRLRRQLRPLISRSWHLARVVLPAIAVLVGCVLSGPSWALPPHYAAGWSGWDKGNIESAFDPINQLGGGPMAGEASALIAQTFIDVQRDSLGKS